MICTKYYSFVWAIYADLRLPRGIFNNLLKEKGLTATISCDSAGTADYHVGENPDPRTIQVAKKNSIAINHKGRQFSVKDFDNFDLIVAMDESNYHHIIHMARHDADTKKVVLMRNYDATQSGGNVPDPWYGDLKDFDACYRLLLECAENLLARTVVSLNCR